MKIRTAMTGVMSVAFVTMAACAGAPKPTEQLVQARASMASAQAVGAEKVPQAQLHAQLAKEELDQADKLMNGGDNERAASVLSRAKADAELAIALAHRADAEKSLEQVDAKVGQAGAQVSSAN